MVQNRNIRRGACVCVSAARDASPPLSSAQNRTAQDHRAQLGARWHISTGRGFDAAWLNRIDGLFFFPYVVSTNPDDIPQGNV